jgi:DNA mismatch repair ATPase MutS
MSLGNNNLPDIKRKPSMTATRIITSNVPQSSGKMLTTLQLRIDAETLQIFKDICENHGGMSQVLRAYINDVVNTDGDNLM